jgi:RES domain-containing protein
MTLEVWRIVKARHAATAFTGEGAAKTGGRWNSRGVAVVYASATLLEILVHLNPPVPMEFVAIRAVFDVRKLRKLEAHELPQDWRTGPPGAATQRIGDRWVRESASAVLAVPSVLVPEETNYLFNPAHPDFGQVALGRPEPLALDPRLRQ